MKNIAENSMGYSGIVTLYQSIGNQKEQIAQTHNAGTYSLFNFFADCLVDDFATARYNLPARIMLLECNTDNVSNLAESICDPISTFVTRQCAPEKIYEPGVGVVRFSFVLPRAVLINYLNSNEYGPERLIGIGLYPARETDHRNYLALCGLKLNASELASTATLLLDWELRITNATGESIENEELAVEEATY